MFKYLNLLVMTTLSFISMFILMYAMVDSFSNLYLNLNQLYMAAFMTIPMILIELALMQMMYTNQFLNTIIALTSAALFGVLFVFIRNQTAIKDREFLRSMIPHHASAILMCERATIIDPEIQQLCKEILEGQQKEIDFMKKKLAQL